ncbi:MAG: hypothetical protein B0D84_02170, partial [Candidatus Sedimenticola endophacoides]
MAELIRTTIEELGFINNDQLISTTASIGIAYLDKTVNNSQEFINQAYRACEEAKSAGGNQYMVFDPEDLSEKYTETAASDAEGDEAIVKMIGESLAKDNFRLLFQPVVSLQGDTRENYAVLLRMLDGQGNEIRPLQFLKHAVASGQMVDIDRWVIKHAIET